MCGLPVDQYGTHSLSCHSSHGRFSRHGAVNDIIRQSLAAIKVPLHLEPPGLTHSDDKHPDGATIIPWKNGHILVWDATIVDTFAPSCASLISGGPRSVATNAEYRKKVKYSSIMESPFLCP